MRNLMQVKSFIAKGILALLGVVVAGNSQADYVVQVGTFAREANASRMTQRLQGAGFPVLLETLPGKNGRELSVVSVGPFPGREAARAYYVRLKDSGWKGYIRRYEKPAAPPPSTDLQPDPNETAAQYQPTTAATTLPPVVTPVKHEAPSPPTPAEQEQQSAPEVFVFGAVNQTAAENMVNSQSSRPEAEDKSLSAALDKVQLETGGLYKSGQNVDSSNYLHAAFSLDWRPNARWEARLAGRADGYYQAGDPDFNRTQLDYGESFVRYRGENNRFTFGTQTILWGRVDEIPPTDRLSVVDLTRFILDELPERRRAVPALRLESFHGPFKTDLVWIPRFRAAELPHPDSIWSPVDQRNGRLLGLGSNAILDPVVQRGSFGEDEKGDGGFGIRVSHTGDLFDYALTAQRFKHSTPYYQVHPVVRARILAGDSATIAVASTSENTFTARHPRSWLLGGDIGFVRGRSTWRFEAAYLSDVPATTTDYRLIALEGVDWVVGVEFYPGDTEARVNLQLSGHHLRNAPAILDRDETYFLNGEIEQTFRHNRWRGLLRFSFGLDKRDVYLNPELAYTGFEPHEFYAGAHHFEGSDGTAGGFHKGNSLLTIGWRASY